MPGYVCGFVELTLLTEARASLLAGNPKHCPRGGERGNNRPTRAPTRKQWRTSNAPAAPRDHRPEGVTRQGLLCSPPPSPVRGDERKISAEAMVQSRRRGEAPRPLTPITTVSSPLNLGMNLSPRRISASLRGRNRHITLMLHSAGSAISGPDRRRSEDGWGAGLGSATEEAANRPLPAARPPPAASQQVIASRLWTARQLRHREGEQPIRWAALLLTSSPVVRPRPTCPRPRDGRTRRCSGSNPRPAQTSRASASSAILHQHQPAPAPPGPPLRPASAR